MAYSEVPVLQEPFLQEPFHKGSKILPLNPQTSEAGQGSGNPTSVEESPRSGLSSESPNSGLSSSTHTVPSFLIYDSERKRLVFSEGCGTPTAEMYAERDRLKAARVRPQ